ncbi:MAG: hypothetical protein KBD76_16445 [Bacteriovorax sp.]|nr:hypothetical protein [Bacteriovorax sp.]
MKQFKDKISILILDYNKPEESLLCLESVHKHCKFEKEVVFYSNGGEQDYAIDFYKEGLIDKLVLSKKNWGLGCGTTDLLQLCRTEYFIYLQNDQFFFRDLNEKEEIFNLKNFYHNRFNCGSISLAGFPCGEFIYSDRCHFGKTQFFRDMDKWGGSYPDEGCGIFWNGPETYNENFIQRFYKEHGILHFQTGMPYVIDNGKTSIRENPDGSIFKHNPDSKQLWVIKAPKEKQAWPENLLDSEWISIIDGTFEQGSIPENWKKDSFIVPQWR